MARAWSARDASRRAVAGVFVFLMAGCAGSTRPANPFTDPVAGATSMRVEVRNDNFLDATIYYTQLGGPQRRVGDVVGNGRRTFQVPIDFTGDVQFRIELLADGWCTTHPIVASPGDVIGLQIVPDFPGAANCQDAGGE